MCSQVMGWCWKASKGVSGVGRALGCWEDVVGHR